MATPDDVVGADHQEGDAADAIRNAEIALAHQNSTTAQVDLQVVTAVLNAHQKAAAGKDALSRLQRDIEDAVTTRSDLDTPSGARDFQRFLIGKLRDIRAVVAGASLDDTSNSALMAAWTSLYHADQSGAPDAAGDRRAPGAAPAQPAAAETISAPTEPDAEPSLDDDDIGLPFDDVPAQPAPSPAATGAGMPSTSPFGGAGFPGGGSVPGLGLPGGFALPGPLPGGDESPRGVDASKESTDPEDRLASDEDDHEDSEPAAAQPARPGPTTVTLPDGETLTAASPQLAAAIAAAAAGTPIADAFQHEGITIPPPGTAVTDPVDAAQLAPGDIGMFTDHHALALGDSKALVNGQIQQISTVTGPGFLGWEHPPVPVSTPNKTNPPVPTRPAIAETTETA